ncbi:MAG: thiamine pyrophosphate-dependent enzyme [Chloroflexota bacterium]
MNRLNRRDAIKTLLHERGDLLVVTGLGSPAYDVASAGNHPLDFPSWGAMGGALMMGLGLALAQPERNVLVVTGDGEMLMGIGSFSTVGAVQPSNLKLVVMDNGLYGETGRQTTHTDSQTDLAAVARACGIEKAYTITKAARLEKLREEIHNHAGPLVAILKVSNAEVPRVLPPIDGPYLTQRMRTALLGEAAALRA